MQGAEEGEHQTTSGILKVLYPKKGQNKKKCLCFTIKLQKQNYDNKSSVYFTF